MAKRRVATRTFIQRSREVAPSKKAEIHNELGAGKRGVIRAFFGLNDDDVDQITARIQQHIDREVA